MNLLNLFTRKKKHDTGAAAAAEAAEAEARTLRGVPPDNIIINGRYDLFVCTEDAEDHTVCVNHLTAPSQARL